MADGVDVPLPGEPAPHSDMDQCYLGVDHSGSLLWPDTARDVNNDMNELRQVFSSVTGVAAVLGSPQQRNQSLPATPCSLYLGHTYVPTASDGG